jgi:hypothetical protein
MPETTPLYDYQAITADYGRSHKNDNRNAMAMQENADMYNYYMWLNELNAQREDWNYQFDKANEYNDPLAARQRLERAGINPAFANLGANSASMPSVSIPQSKGSQAAQTFPDDLTMKDAMDSIHSSVSNYFQGRQTEASVRNLEANSDFLERSSSARVLQEQQKYLNMVKEAENIDGDTAYKRMLKDTGMDGLLRLRRLSGYYDSQVIGAARKYKQDEYESNSRIMHNYISDMLGLRSDSRAEKQLDSLLRETNEKINLMRSQGEVNKETVKSIQNQSELFATEVLGRQLDNGEKSELYDLIIEEAKGEHKLWQMQHDVDLELFPADQYGTRLAKWIMGRPSAGAAGVRGSMKSVK